MGSGCPGASADNRWAVIRPTGAALRRQRLEEERAAQNFACIPTRRVRPGAGMKLCASGSR
ncbi:Uncharacterised protein [Acinetobacter baumannii]|nr:Uncharacterised protein [Acinetobacter baumannii]